MISALKKKLGGNNLAPPSHSSNSNSTEPSPSHSRTPVGVNVVSQELQKKFAHGVNYNMKIVIRGDRNSGKTCLWKRIQGQPFCEAYSPTEEIQAANIMWNYRASDHIVKLDIWDVVDESPKRRLKSAGLKLDNSDIAEYETPACDAGFVDVYKNCNGVLLIFDITKPWTFLYVKKELENIPSHIPVLVLANKRDLENQRQIREEEIVQFLRSFNRKPPSHGKFPAQIRYTQASMKNAFGLKYLYRFLNIPFLFLQRETLEAMLEANKQDIELSYCEMDLLLDNKDTGFETYSKLQKDNGNHEFSTDTEKAALSNNNSRNHSASKEEDPTVLPLRNRKISSSSEGDNRMVATFEEDFDSGDEEVHLEVYSKKLDALQPEIDNNISRPPSSRFHSTLQSPQSPKKPLDLPLPPPPTTASSNIDLDAWLESSSPDIDTTHVSAVRLDSTEDDEEEDKQNPLVAPIPSDDDGSDDDDEDDNEGTIQSNEGSTSGSNMGFTVLSTKMTSMQISPIEMTIRKKEVEKATIKKSKKKKATTLEAGAAAGKKKKKATKIVKPENNLLVEDLTSPVDAEQYESL
uniref:Rab-like protein 6 n=1 Tax=Panagrolaimus sp. ES5 TaxID=591445 RepID=A0AC34GYG6_9BILA